MEWCTQVKFVLPAAGVQIGSPIVLDVAAGFL